jgi:hypothetical protein
MTPYQYTYQNPVRFIDPTGMAPEGPGDPPTKANRNNHGFKVGGKWEDKTGVYTVSKITDEGIEWSSMSNSHVDSDGTINIIQSTHKTEFRSKFGQWWHGLFTRDGDRGYGFQGDASQTFLYIYSMNGGNPSSGDRGFFKNGDKIIDINFDEFITPMGSASRASNLFEIISQTISTWNNASSAINKIGLKEKQYDINLKVRIYDSDSLYSGAISKGSVFTKDTTIRLKGNFRETYGRKYEFERKYKQERFDNYLNR